MTLDELRGPLRHAAHTDRTTFRPEILRCSLPADAARIGALVSAGACVHDEIQAQLIELVRCLNPAKRFSPEEAMAAATEHLAGGDPLLHGVWVYYPWSHKLVHLLDEEEFALVRTDRNRNKITREEQAVLATKKVGVIGLSVGQSVALTMALERGFGEIRLADFDTLDLSNLNRIRSGVHEMGTPKVINTAREIAELDPFLQVTVFDQGLTRDNLDAFFTHGGHLDLVIEECDSVNIKILARQKAKALRIPVVMDTSDRGLVDVERFDLEPDRPIMHGFLEELDLSVVEGEMTAAQKVPLMSRFVGMDTISDRMRASLPELGRTILTWPQLASAVVLGGAALADIVRRILLGVNISSQRQWIDLEELVPAMPESAYAPIQRTV
jgi:molybdopterin/thiamine biosynthesis adenylyltransferase